VTDVEHDGPGPLDRVSVSGIRAHGYHGVLAHEKRDGQEFSCDVALHVRRLRGGHTDDLRDAVDYSVVAKQAHDVLVGPSFDLVEAVAERIAAAVLTDSRIAAVEVTVHKPQAPVGVPFGDVTVRIVRTRDDARADTAPPRPVRAVLGLGANLGDSHATLHQAVLDLAATDGVDVVEASPVVDSSPVGGPPQGRYLNAVLLVDTTLSPRALLRACQDVEQKHGRERRVRWGPRTLDVDVVTVLDPDGGTVRLETEDLDLPHPEAAGRRFVLLPWSLVGTGTGVLPWWDGNRSVHELLEELDDEEQDVVVRRDLALPFGLPAGG
jgi:dihydroneopterin aldolase/2-amino-4-hydroxy-6-hydroxymethyldihydropteridine diphosphokinase